MATGQYVPSLPAQLEGAAWLFQDIVTPEVAHIDDDLREMRGAAEDIVNACAELAQSCRDYKQGLEELREKLSGILDDLKQEAIETAVITVAASLISFGAGAIVGTAKAAKAIKTAAKAIREAVEAWQLAKKIGQGVKATKDLKRLRAVLDRIKSLARREAPTAPKLHPTIGPAVRTTGAKPLGTTRAQIESKYKHAEDFGVTESRGKAGFDEFEQAVKHHVDNQSTIHIDGTYRGNPAILNYNPETGLVVVQSPAGQFISGWRLTEVQIANVLQYGKLGGG